MCVVTIFKNAKQLKERSVSLRKGLQRPLKLIKHIIFRTEASPQENIQKEKCWEIHCVYEVLCVISSLSSCEIDWQNLLQSVVRLTEL